MPVDNTYSNGQGVSEDSETCCPDEPVNPKKRFRQGRGARAVNIFDVVNPIPGQVTDNDEVKQTFEKFNFVPYAGSENGTGDTLLAWYSMLAKLSPTHRACINKKIKYAINDRVVLLPTEDTDFDVNGSDTVEITGLTQAQKIEYRDTVKKYINFGKDGIIGFHKKIARSYETNGNGFAECTIVDIEGEKRISLKFIKTSNAKYVGEKTKEGADVVGVSTRWDYTYLEKKPPRLVTVFPFYTKEKGGVLKTMFHLKNGDDGKYGRPDSEGGDLSKYREVQDEIYLIKQSNANFTGQLIIEVEDDDPEVNPVLDLDSEGEPDANFDTFAEKFEGNFTQKSQEPQSVLLTARPYGARPMFVFQVAPNTNENWYKVTGEINEKKITKSHNLTMRFMGEDVAGGFSQDVFLSDYIVNIEPVINEFRSTICGFTNKILEEIWNNVLLMPKMNEISITFVEPIREAVQAFKERSKNGASQTGFSRFTPKTEEV